MANKRTIITKDELELQETNGEPIAMTLKEFLLESRDPDEDLLAGYELAVKVQRLDRRGRPEHGVKFRTDQLVHGDTDLFDDILDDPELGPGRYNFFIEYRKIDPEGPWKVVIVKDLSVGTTTRGFQVQNPPEPREDAALPALQMVMQSIAENNKLLMTMVTTMINKNPGSESAAVVKALEKGIELATNAMGQIADDPDDGEEEGETSEEKLLKLGLKIFELAKSRPEGDPLRETVREEGLDPNAQIPPHEENPGQ